MVGTPTLVHDGSAFTQQKNQPTIPEDARQVDVVVERRTWIKGRVVTDKGDVAGQALVVALQGDALRVVAGRDMLRVGGQRLHGLADAAGDPGGGEDGEQQCSEGNL